MRERCCGRTGSCNFSSILTKTGPSACALRSVGRDCLKRFFKADIYAIIHRTVEQLGEDIGVLDAPGGNADVEMMTHFYVLAATGSLKAG